MKTLSIPEDFWKVITSTTNRDIYFFCAIKLYEVLYVESKTITFSKQDARNYLNELARNEGEDFDSAKIVRDFISYHWLEETYNGAIETLMIPLYARMIISTFRDIIAANEVKQVRLFKEIVQRLDGMFNGTHIIPRNEAEIKVELKSIAENENIIASNIRSLIDDQRRWFESTLEKSSGNEFLKNFIHHYSETKSKMDKDFSLLETAFNSIIAEQMLKWDDKISKLDRSDPRYRDIDDLIIIGNTLQDLCDDIRRCYDELNDSRTKILNKAICQWKYADYLKQESASCSLDTVIGKIAKLKRYGCSQEELDSILEDTYTLFEEPLNIFDLALYQKQNDIIFAKKERLILKNTYNNNTKEPDFEIDNWESFESRHTQNGRFSIHADEIITLTDVKEYTSLLANRLSRPDIQTGAYEPGPLIDMTAVSWEVSKE